LTCSPASHLDLQVYALRCFNVLRPFRMTEFWVEIGSLGWRPPSVCKNGI
jgi:hypothetical protein